MMMISQFYQLTYLEGHLYNYFRIGISSKNATIFQEIVSWDLKKGQNFIFVGCVLCLF